MVSVSGTTSAIIPGIVFNFALVRLATGKSSTTWGSPSQLCTRSPHAAAMTLLAAEEHLEAAGMRGWLQAARLRRGHVEAGPDGTARSTTASEALKALGAANPETIATLLVPFPA